ncbi:MAG: hypothetical protein H7Z72_09520 [Bacteroidetes bacterium]|nr:hypothetical protein [Fibrella sp.]
MWSTTHFPAAMRSLNPTTRAKAIEIANGLFESGYTDKQQIIVSSVDQARAWIRCQTVGSSQKGPDYQVTTV